MPEWLHCNNCYTRFRPNIKFYVTSCGHIICHGCVSKIQSNNICFVCNSACEFIQLSNNLKPNIQCYFRPATETADIAKQVCSFQLTNSLSLIRNLTAKYNNAKGEIQKAYKIIQDLKKDQLKLKTMLKASMRGASGGGGGMGFTSTPMVQTSASHSVGSNVNMTPRSNDTSVNSFIQYERPPTTGFVPWNNRGPNGRFMTMRQYPSGLDSTSSQLFLTPTGGFHERPPVQYPIINNRGSTAMQNPAMIPMSGLHMNSENKPH